MADPVFYRTADGNAARFWWGTEKNNVASQTAGRPIFDKVLMMEISKPGDRDSKPHFMIERHFSDGTVKQFNGETKGPNGQTQRGPWREIMHDQLKAWESQQTGGAMNGTPLSECTWVDIALAESLKAVGVHTAEALAEVPDSHLHSLGHDGRKLRDKAKAYLEAAAGNAPIERLTNELETARQETETLKAQMAELLARLPKETETETPAPRRGRPPAQRAA